MTKKMYYTDPLAAAIMMRDFGVKILSNRNGVECLKLSTVCNYAALNKAQFKSDLIVHPDSLHIFEPQVGDVMQRTGDKGLWTINKEGNASRWEWEGVIVYPDVYLNALKIIQRDNKPFFTPEVEND